MIRRSKRRRAGEEMGKIRGSEEEEKKRAAGTRHPGAPSCNPALGDPRDLGLFQNRAKTHQPSKVCQHSCSGLQEELCQRYMQMRSAQSQSHWCAVQPGLGPQPPKAGPPNCIVAPSCTSSGCAMCTARKVLVAS